MRSGVPQAQAVGVAAWVSLVLVVALGGALVASSRVAQFGVDIANDPRYLIDFAWLVPLSLCAAFSRQDVLEPAPAEPGGRLTVSRIAPSGAIAGVLLIVYAAGSVASASKLQRDWPGSQARTWETNVRSGIAAVGGQRPTVAENTTPFEVMADFVAPYNRLSRLLPLYVGPVQVDGPIMGPLVQVLEDGTVRRVTLTSIDGAGAVQTLTGLGQLSVSGGRTVSVGGQLCVIADATSAKLEWTAPPGAVAGPGPFYMVLGYKVWASVAMPVFVDSGHGYPGEPNDGIALDPSANSSIVWLGPAEPHDVRFELPPVNTVCLSHVEVGSLAAQR